MQGGGPDGKSLFMSHSYSLDGPWSPTNSTPGTCGMPTAAYHPNGTLFVICGNGHSLVSTDEWDGGKWRFKTTDSRTLDPPLELASN